VSERVVRIDERGGHWIRLVLNAPKGNPLTIAMVSALRDALGQASTAPGVR
jgi:enoyl-CoA hydratase/carnithine racemase